MNLDKLNELLLNPEQRHVEPRVGQIGHNLMGIDRKSIDQEARTIDFVCSTPDVDRYGEIVLPQAFAASLKQFMMNPVFPFGHHYEASGDQLPTVGHWKDMRVDGNALIGKAHFKQRGLGEECWLDYIEGHLTSVSVAWLTKAWEMQEREIGGVTKRVRVFTEVELIEVSAVLIPANPQARLRAASAFAAQPHGVALGRRIRARREELDLTLEEVAESLPIDASTLGQIELGEIIRPPDEVLQAIADALDMSFPELQRLADADQDSGNGGDDHKQFDDALERRIASILERQLDASSGGRLCSMIQDIAATLHGHAGYQASGYFGDVPDDEEPPASPSAKDTGDPELKTMLRDALGNADAA